MSAVVCPWEGIVYLYEGVGCTSVVKPEPRPTLKRSRRSALSFCTNGSAPELDRNCSHGSKMATDENKVTVCALVTLPKLVRATRQTAPQKERSRGCKLVQRWSAPEICLKNVERSSVGRVSGHLNKIGTSRQ